MNTLSASPQLSATELRQGSASQSNRAQGDGHIFHANPEDQVPAHPARIFRLVLTLSRLPRPVLLSRTFWPFGLVVMLLQHRPQPGRAMICNLIHLVEKRVFEYLQQHQ